MPASSCGNQKCLQTLPNIPCGTKLPLNEDRCLRLMIVSIQDQQNYPAADPRGLSNQCLSLFATEVCGLLWRKQGMQ